MYYDTDYEECTPFVQLSNQVTYSTSIVKVSIVRCIEGVFLSFSGGGYFKVYTLYTP